MNIKTNTEFIRFDFERIKKEMLKKYPGATTHCSPAGYYITANGANVIPNKYPSLQHSDSVYQAWKNLKVVEHWERIEARNTKGFAADIRNNTVQNTPTGVAKEIYEWFMDDINPEDEENRYE